MKKRENYVAIPVTLAKMVVLALITFAIAFPLMIKALEWFCGLWGYTTKEFYLNSYDKVVTYCNRK